MMLALAVLAAVSLSAAPLPASTEAQLKAAEEAFDEGKFDGALKILEPVLTAQEDGVLVSRAHLLAGQCLNAKGDAEGTERSFGAALEADPEARLDPNSVSPPVVAVLERLRKRLNSEIRVTADHATAIISLDGTRLGGVPLRAVVAIGRHQLEARTPDGRFAETREVVLRPRHTLELTFVLREAGGPAVASQTPAESRTPTAGVAAARAGSGALPIVLWSVGGAALAASVTLEFLARNTAQGAWKIHDEGGFQSEVVAGNDRARLLQGLAGASLGVGAAGVVAGFIARGQSSPGEEGPSTPVGVALSASGSDARVVVHGVFGGW